jgi:chorismate synthase
LNTFGRIFKINIFGESHGNSVGIVIDGCPAGINICENDFATDLLRRKSGAFGTTPRIEPDKPVFLSGIFNSKTTGNPITIIFENTNTKSSDYNFTDFPRPGHADFVAQKKYFENSDLRGGGHFSGRLTLGLVTAGVIAKKIIDFVKINAKLSEVCGSEDIQTAIKNAIEEGDSVGGIISCTAKNIPAGWGEPFFDSVESLISHAIFAIPGIKGIEFGSGFDSAKKLGSQLNDLFIDENGKTETNFAGGINGGITNGNEITFKVAVKPTSSISKEQITFNFKTKKLETLKIQGRHDACIAVRAVPVVEAVTAIVLADLFLLRKTQEK